MEGVCNDGLFRASNGHRFLWVGDADTGFSSNVPAYIVKAVQCNKCVNPASTVELKVNGEVVYSG